MMELLTPTKLVKSNRKSISLIIKNNGDFEVRMPLNAKIEDVNKFIIKKADWIINKRLEQRNNAIEPLTLEKAEQLQLLGKIYNIKFYDLSRVKLNDTEILLPKLNSKEKLIKFLKKKAKDYFEERSKLIAELFNFKYQSISISSAKSCWGSCSHNNKLHFTYKLIMCPLDVIDYIVLHELCHTKIKNHSREFWKLVEQCCPNYKTQEKWLKKNRAIIELI